MKKPITPPAPIEPAKTEVKKIDNEILQVSIIEQLKEAYTASTEDLAYIEGEFSGFCKNQQLKKALLNSVDLLKAGDYDSIRSIVNNALKAGFTQFLASPGFPAGYSNLYFPFITFDFGTRLFSIKNL